MKASTSSTTLNLTNMIQLSEVEKDALNLYTTSGYDFMNFVAKRSRVVRNVFLLQGSEIPSRLMDEVDDILLGDPDASHLDAVEDAEFDLANPRVFALLKNMCIALYMLGVRHMMQPPLNSPLRLLKDRALRGITLYRGLDVSSRDQALSGIADLSTARMATSFVSVSTSMAVALSFGASLECCKLAITFISSFPCIELRRTNLDHNVQEDEIVVMPGVFYYFPQYIESSLVTRAKAINLGVARIQKNTYNPLGPGRMELKSGDTKIFRTVLSMVKDTLSLMGVSPEKGDRIDWQLACEKLQGNPWHKNGVVLCIGRLVFFSCEKGCSNNESKRRRKTLFAEMASFSADVHKTFQPFIPVYGELASGSGRTNDRIDRGTDLSLYEWKGDKKDVNGMITKAVRKKTSSAKGKANKKKVKKGKKRKKNKSVGRSDYGDTKFFMDTVVERLEKAGKAYVERKKKDGIMLNTVGVLSRILYEYTSKYMQKYTDAFDVSDPQTYLLNDFWIVPQLGKSESLLLALQESMNSRRRSLRN